MMDKQGSLYCLRHEIKEINSRFRLCQFRPDLKSPKLDAAYNANILRVVRQVYYSEHNKNSIDLVLFLNGIPVASCELKTDFTQNIQDAINQYKYDRNPKDPATKHEEPLLAFKKRALVHFAVSTDEVYMSSRLMGKDTLFLPFNKGRDGAAGNPPNPNGYATAYLWEEILRKDTWLKIIGRYVHLEVKEKEDFTGKKYKSESLIFPRYHQLDAVTSLLSDAKTNGAGQKYLIQHSAGSGKSNSIAWLAHQLSSLHTDTNERVFNSVIVVTDRTVLDSQLQETISQFEHKDGVVVRINREDGGGSKSAQLTGALEKSAAIIIVTIQTFPFVIDAIRKKATLRGRKYAIIADEAHSSQTGKTAKGLKEVLSTEQNEDGELSAEDILRATLEAKADNSNISYFAFTATPKSKTLEMFGQLPDPTRPPAADNIPYPFHVYTMRQAIEEGFIIDVLKSYTTYDLSNKTKINSTWIQICLIVAMEISQEILNQLRELKNSKCKKERTHAHALLLLNKGKSIQEVAEIFDVTQRSVYNWIKKFKNEGIASLSRQAGAGRKTILNESDKDIIEKEISQYPHQPKKAYAMTLEKLYIKMSYKTFTRFLKKHSI